MIRSVFRLIDLPVFGRSLVLLLPYARISGAKLLCSTSRILCWYFNVLIFVGVRYTFSAGFSMRFKKLYIKKGSAESASPEYICLDVKSSVIFSSGCFVVKAFAFQRLKFRLYFNIMAYLVQECRKGIAKLISS